MDRLKWSTGYFSAKTFLLKLAVATSVVLTFGLRSSSADFSYFLKISGDRPYGITFDGKGAMYMVTAPPTGSGTLSIVTPDGKITKLAALNGTFIGPGVAVDDSGNALVTVGDKLLRITPDGTTRTIADGFTRSFDVKLDKSGNIYVADDIKDVVYKITPDGKKGVFYSSDTTGDFILTAICIDHDRRSLYVRDGRKLFKLPLDPDTNSTKPQLVLEDPDMFYMCLDSSNNIYVSTLKNVIKIDSAGSVKNLSSEDMNTSIGLSIGGSGFDEQTLYVAVDDGIIEVSTISGLKGKQANPPEGYMLRQNFPNPFNPSTTIDYQLTVNSPVALKVYDVLGREVGTLVNRRQNAGEYSVTFDGSKLSTGVYFYKLASGSNSETRQMVLLK